jgi:hypothetical protein
MTEIKRRDRTGYLTERRAKRRQLLKDHIGGKCVACGSLEDLQFNHKNPAEKQFTISEIIHKNLDFVLKEVEKCELLCKECHKEETRRQYKDGELQVWNAGTRKPYVHGTCRMYQQRQCRCEPCILANHLYMKHKVVGFQQVIEEQWIQIFALGTTPHHCQSEQAREMLARLQES